jgi:protocatechuate 3,4-dioxygenase beta subunit
MKFPAPPAGTYPESTHATYQSTGLRGPKQPPVAVELPAASEIVIPDARPIVTPRDADLTAWGQGEPLGERIVVTGRVTDEDGRPARNSLVEIWQCNAAGRYAHKKDQHHAPLDPNFPGQGKTTTDEEGYYRFVTIKPGAYPWGNHPNAWRPAHIHFSLFGNAYAQRLITQMYFPGDPLFEFDPIFNSIPDEAARRRLVSRFKLEHTVEGIALGYQFDIVLRGRDATPMGL